MSAGQFRKYMTSTAWAIGSVVAMTLVRVAFERHLQNSGPIIFYFAAVIAAAFFGGAIAGTLSALLSCLPITYLFLAPRMSWEIANPNDQFLLFIFVVEAFLISGLAGSLRQKQARLRESEERHRVLGDAIPTITWSLNSDGSLNHFNRRWYEFTGVPTEVGQTERWIEVIHPDDRAHIKEKRELAIRNGWPYEAEMRIRSRSGEYRWFEASVEPLKGSDGHIISWYGSALDIDARKKSEAELRAAKETAENAAQLKTQFLANMSHEIRTPMNAILGFGDLLSEEKLSDGERLEFASRIKSNGDQLLHLIDDILDLSKLEAGGIRIEKLRFSVADLVFDVVGQLRPLADKKSLEIGIELENAIPQVVCSDPVRIKQILTNLVGNAVKFTEKGRIDVQIRYVEHLQHPTQGCLQIRVSDTGIGLAPEQRRDLFQPFKQADVSITRKFGGTGLGLALSRRFAHALGGNVSIEKSTVGEGSTFLLTFETGDVAEVLFTTSLHGLPLSQPARPLTVASKKLRQLAGVRVLLADDSPDGEALARLYLQMEGAIVESARDGFEAVKMATGDEYDIVLMDIQMPGLDGLSATRLLREKGYRKPIVALTAHALREEVDRSLAAGCNAHLAKPINRQSLVTAIRAQLGKSVRAEDHALV